MSSSRRATGTTDKKKKKKRSSARKSDIFERLTDPKNFKGTHRHRFDEDGKGRGLAGRDRVAKGAGSVGMGAAGGQVNDLSQVLRPNVSKGRNTVATGSASGPTASSADSPDKPKPKRRSRGSRRRSSEREVVSRLTDPKNFPGAHKHRFDPETGKGRGKAGRDSVPKGGGSVNVTHDPEAGDSVQDLSQILRPSVSRAAPADSKPKPKRASVKKKRASGKRSSKRASGGGSIFDRLTDPSQYKGIHKHRFDSDGKGRGLAGRDSVAKGGGYGRHRGGAVQDLSQITRSS